MTEFKYVTSVVERIGRAEFNSDKVKLYVDVSSQGWQAANKLVEEELKAEDPKFFYKTRSRTFLWEKYFRQSHKVHTLDFWESLLGNMSEVDILEIHKQTKSVIRKTLMDVIGHYINCGCVLLPLVPPRSLTTPAWHGNMKPKIVGFPYEGIFASYLKDCASSEDRTRRAESRFCQVFASTRVQDFEDISMEFDERLSKAIRDKIGDDDFSEYVKLMAVVARYCCIQSGEDPFATYFHRTGSVALRSSPTVNSVSFSVETDTTLRFDLLQTMRNYIGDQLTNWNIVNRDAWLEDISDWVLTKDNKSIAPLYSDVCSMFEWMSLNGLGNKKSIELKRADFIATRSKSTHFTTFFEVLKTSDKQLHAKSRIVRNLVDFFAYCHDKNLDNFGHSVLSPITEGDKKRFADTRNYIRGKSNKPVLPRRIMNLAKDLLLEDDYAFARKFSDQYVNVSEGGEEKRLLIPTISNLLFLILSIPIRTAQAMMLDSGEADEFVVSLDGYSIKNDHPLAQKGRRLGYARRFSNANGMAQFCGIFVNTNKENVLEQRGYEIPYHDARLMEVLQSQRAFQEAFNPITVLVDRSQLGSKDLRYQGNNADRLESYTFLFRDIRKGSLRWDALNKNRIVNFWLQLLLEVQHRLEADETPVQLVWEDEKGNLRTDYTLHSLRVSNITHFIEAGVPLHVLAEFLSGHQSLVIALYYTKLGPQRINEVIAEASRNLLEAEEDEFFDRLTKLTDELLNERVVGKADGIARLPNGDPGLWHVDVDGFCTAGKTLCGEGLERRDPATGISSYEPISPNGFNCALCRYHVTGPPFLAGQVTVANTLLYSIRERSEQQDKLYQKVTDARKKGNSRLARRAQDQLDKVAMELEERIAALGTRIGNIYASLDLMNKEDDRESLKTTLITQMGRHEIEAQLAEASNFEGMEWASQAIEFFPQIPDSGARFRKGVLLERMAQENGLKPILLHLSEDEMHKAGNRLTILMANLYGQSETSDLLSCKLKLEQFGGLTRFEAMVGEAIRLCDSDPTTICSGDLLIGAK